MSVVSVRLTEEVTQELEALAQATGWTQTFLASLAITDYLQRESRPMVLKEPVQQANDL